MKKIMFNDRYGLTAAVLSGRKTQTRRIIPNCTGVRQSPFVKSGIEDNHGYELKPKYTVGEEVAVAQPYSHITDEFRAHQCIQLSKLPSWNNKLYVRADLMPHHIRMTNVRVERLQDISSEDCLREGIVQRFDCGGTPYFKLRPNDDGRIVYRNPREAYADLIDRISGKGTWDSNPWMFAYDFELVK